MRTLASSCVACAANTYEDKGACQACPASSTSLEALYSSHLCASVKGFAQEIVTQFQLYENQAYNLSGVEGWRLTRYLPQTATTWHTR